MGTVVNIQTGGAAPFGPDPRPAAYGRRALGGTADLTISPRSNWPASRSKSASTSSTGRSCDARHRVSPKAAMIMYGVIALTVFVDLIAAVALWSVRRQCTDDRTHGQAAEPFDEDDEHPPGCVERPLP